MWKRGKDNIRNLKGKTGNVKSEKEYMQICNEKVGYMKKGDSKCENSWKENMKMWTEKAGDLKGGKKMYAK